MHCLTGTPLHLGREAMSGRPIFVTGLSRAVPLNVGAWSAMCFHEQPES
jgi:hypothetical protein